MRKTLIILSLTVIIGIVGGLLLGKYDTKPESPLKADRGDVMAGLVACLLGDKCKLTRTTEVVDGHQFYGVYLRIPEKGVNIKYAMEKGDGKMMVAFIKDNDNQLSVTDFHLRGVVDLVLETTAGKTEMYGPLDPAHLGDYEDVQGLYDFALQEAWDKVISLEIRKSLEENPDTERFRS
jgi:hypothetical protein